MCRWRCEYPDPFIVQWEIPEPTDERERMYIVFNGIKEYKRYMAKYNTCHELFIAHTLDKSEDVTGHPAFDIDAPLDMEMGWEKKLERDVEEVLRLIHPKKEFNLRFVWLISPNETKTSRHLVVHGVTFLQWRYSSTVLYRELEKRCSHIDNMILRSCGSLRLPLNSKVGGNPLYFKGDNEFEDGLIMIHDDNMNIGTLLTPNDIDPSFLTIKDIMGKEASEVDEVDESECRRAFDLLDRTFDLGLKMGHGATFIPLERVRPGTCPLSGRVHDNVGAYMYSRRNRIYYGCHRKCSIRLDGKERKSIDVTVPRLTMAEEIAARING